MTKTLQSFSSFEIPLRIIKVQTQLSVGLSENPICQPYCLIPNRYTFLTIVVLILMYIFNANIICHMYMS